MTPSSQILLSRCSSKILSGIENSTCIFLSKVSIGDEVLLKFSGVPLGEACSVVLRGATEQIIGNYNKTSLGASAGLHFFGGSVLEWGGGGGEGQVERKTFPRTNRHLIFFAVLRSRLDFNQPRLREKK